MSVKSIKLTDIRLDGGTQPRVEIDAAVVAEYHEAFAEGAVMPPLSVYFDGAAYWLADGFHRLHALRKLGAVTADCQITNGTQRDAVVAACSANASHGLRRSNADKRKAVEMMLAVVAGWSDNKIAKHVGVGQPFVGAVRNPEVAAKQAENRKASSKRNAGVKSDLTRAGVGSDLTQTKASSEPANPAVTEAMAELVGERDAAVAAMHEALAENTTMGEAFDADDRTAALFAENKKLRAQVATLTHRVNGLMGEKNEAVRAAKMWQRKAQQVAA